ncbi:MAG: helix-turn-helix domain-containing protein [Candidatus Cloacimonetes bacterium]|nr:helix-turn-helix domain-containing protein [Candidatus Cloacimonadota bacterium]
MFYKIIKPSGFLAQFIKHYWVLEINSSEGEISERVIPTGDIELMFHYKRPFEVLCEKKSHTQYRSFISGINSKFSDISAKGDSGVIVVTFYPHGACNFFRFPLHEIEDSSTDLNEIHPSSVRFIEESISTLTSIDKKISLIEDFLKKSFKQVLISNLSLIQNGVDLINQKKGNVKVSQLASELFTTERTLERKFKAFLGKSPKQYVRIARFKNVLHNLYNTGFKSLTDFSYEYSFCDQAHFTKDFKSMTGYTPGEFLLQYPDCSDYFIE